MPTYIISCNENLQPWYEIGHSPCLLSLCTQPWTFTLFVLNFSLSLILILVASGKLLSSSIVTFLASSSILDRFSSSSFSFFSRASSFLHSCIYYTKVVTLSSNYTKYCIHLFHFNFLENIIPRVNHPRQTCYV